MADDNVDKLLQVRAHSDLPRTHLAKRLIWSLVQATLYRYSFHTWSGWRAMLLRLFGAKIARGCTIRRTSKVYYPWKLTMGVGSCLGDDCEVYNLADVTLGDWVTVSQEAYLCAGSHDYRYRTMPLVTTPIVLKDDSWVCARAFVGPGVTVGAGAIVAAAAVAMRDVDDMTIVAGNPAKFIKRREWLDAPRREARAPQLVPADAAAPAPTPLPAAEDQR
jgi:putative colanic acid biosynthesis acetyltransferase WcaF